MQLAFSTLGIPGRPLSEVVRLASDNGFQGVELRAHPEEPVHPGLSPAGRAQVVDVFGAAGVQILTVAGYARVAAPGEDQTVLTELRGLLELARDLEAPFVRVFPGGDTGTAVGDAAAVRRLTEAAPRAADLGVRILLETHDSHRTGEDVARVLDAVGHPSAGALWDVMHTVRGGEPPARSHRFLAPHLGYTQVKDIASAGDTTPLAPGEGMLPLREVAALLGGPGAGGGWLCWEYEKRWYPGVPELPGLLPSVHRYLSQLPGPSA